MQPLSFEEVDRILLSAAIGVASPSLGIGRELKFHQCPRRIVVVRFADEESLEYLLAVTSRVLELDKKWVLLTRYGSAADLELYPSKLPLGGIAFDGSAKGELAEYLCTRATNAGSTEADLYVLSGKGTALLTWDHHTAQDGLHVEFQSVSDATRLLVSLNQLGAELEVYYSDG
jgi:hypothetical protein